MILILFQMELVQLVKDVPEDFLILDEPTSSMDPKAEQQIFKKFKELSSGRMTILISHRLSTVTMAERIFVFEKGRIVESGTHVDLMQRNGLYSNVFERQAKGFM